MHEGSILFSLFLIFTGAAAMSTIALYARQALPIAYILAGFVAGPSVLAWLDDTQQIEDIARVGIIFLLFLLGLNLYPKKLARLFRETTLVTIVGSLVFAAIGGGVAVGAGFGITDSLIIAVAMMFSSTIIGLKLLPTTVLHHRHTGELMVSILLLQDILAIFALLILQSGGEGVSATQWWSRLLALPALGTAALLAERYILSIWIRRFERIQEFVFLLAIGWCLGMAQAAHYLGLSHEIGAFLGGVALANSPIAPFISERLKPLRDFFLVMFFFALGAGFDIQAASAVLWPALLLAALMFTVKPLVYRVLLVRAAETPDFAWELGARLGQLSEFSLLVAFVAVGSGSLSADAASLIELATIVTFIASTYLVILRYPTPVAISDRLRRD